LLKTLRLFDRPEQFLDQLPRRILPMQVRVALNQLPGDLPHELKAPTGLLDRVERDPQVPRRFGLVEDRHRLVPQSEGLPEEVLAVDDLARLGGLHERLGQVRLVVAVDGAEGGVESASDVPKRLLGDDGLVDRLAVGVGADAAATGRESSQVSRSWLV
jgi:hypothetical protein